MADLETFRSEVRAWLAENCPPEKRGPMREEDHCFGGRDWHFTNDAQRIWLERMAARGWTAPEWPTEYAGGGLSGTEGAILREEMARIKAHPPLTSLGIWMLGPALLRFGTEAQKQQYLPGIVRGEIRWCQGYSEPNAGSDLVSLQTKAELVGDEFIVNGQKIWTSYGHLSDCMFGLVRTDPDKPRHEGLSFILIDMRTPGVSASPLRLISGNEHFSQVFLDDVHVPKENLVGTRGRGWDVAKYLLLFERQMIGGMRAGETTRLSDFALNHLGQEALRAEPVLRARIAEFDLEMAAFETLVERYGEEAAAGVSHGAKSSMLKYFGTELNVKRHALMLSVLGNAGLDMDGAEAKTGLGWLASLPNLIGGGTSEIQLNVVAKRVLELPGG
jgi:acyl-CoA dehydrogenase